MRPRTRHGLVAFGLAAFLLGAVQAAQGAYLPLKAWVGQRLLASAWDRSLSEGTPAKPWSWADITPVARLAAPRIGVSAVVLDSASGEAMAWGPGHVAGTAPLGGPGLAGIAGHRDSHLAFLADLKPGDRLVLETAEGGARRYEVGQAIVVDSSKWGLPQDFGGSSRLALSTCWPFDSQEESPMRFVLFAEAVDS